MIAKLLAAVLTALSIPLSLIGLTRPEPATPSDAEPVYGKADATPYQYVGTKKCRMCHVDQYHSWLESPKGGSWKALQPGVNVETKRRAGLNPHHDYTTDARCLQCHAVGYGKPGGYAIPEPGDDRAAREAEARQGAGCEACHGPGSGFVKIMEDIYLTDRTYRPEELYAAGRKKVEQEVCADCHNKKAICMTWVLKDKDRADGKDELHVTVTDRSGYHAAFPLERRESNQRVQAQLESQESGNGN